jgi:hypothetical protein
MTAGQTTLEAANGATPESSAMTASKSTPEAANGPTPESSAMTASKSTSETANGASSESSAMTAGETTPETATTMAASAATRLRVGCKQAAHQRGGHQHSHYSNQHMRRCIRHSSTLLNDIRVHGATLHICLTTKYLDK